MFKEVDVWDVVCVLAKNDYAPGTEAYDIMHERQIRFDDMSLDMAKRLSRRALQLLEPHLQDGVVIGNIDVDEMLVQLLDVDPQDVDPLVDETNDDSVDMAAGDQEPGNTNEQGTEGRAGDEDGVNEDVVMHMDPVRAQFYE
jgi:hypothetical protein